MESTQAETRPAQESDLPKVQSLLRLLRLHEREEGFNTTVDPEWALSDDAAKRLQQCIASEDQVLLVAIVNSNIVGCLVGHVAHIDGVFVMEGFRRRGIGTRLCQEFLSWVATKRAERVSVAVAVRNIEAISIYEKLGFRQRTLVLERTLEKER